MPIGIKTTDTWEYQFKCDRKPDGTTDPEGTLVTLCYLSAEQHARIQDSLATFLVNSTGGMSEARFTSGTHVLETLKYGVVGWKNYRYADGTPVVFRARNVASFDSMSYDHRTELAEAILERVRVPATLGN